MSWTMACRGRAADSMVSGAREGRPVGTLRLVVLAPDGPVRTPGLVELAPGGPVRTTRPPDSRCPDPR